MRRNDLAITQGITVEDTALATEPGILTNILFYTNSFIIIYNDSIDTVMSAGIFRNNIANAHIFPAQFGTNSFFGWSVEQVLLPELISSCFGQSWGILGWFIV